MKTLLTFLIFISFNITSYAASDRLAQYIKEADTGNGEAAYLAAKIYHQGSTDLRNYPEAVKLYKLAVTGGERRAGFPLGKIYSSQLVAKPDMPYAIEMLEFSATDDTGGEHVMEAAYFLAQIHIGGKDAPNHVPTIYKWLEIAATNGHAGAAADVGYQYYSGTKIEKDRAKALKFTRMAAMRGHAPSQYNMGIFYNSGVGTRVDNAKALAWFIIAKETDPKTDNGSIANFKKAMPASQKKKAEAEAARLRTRLSRY